MKPDNFIELYELIESGACLNRQQWQEVQNHPAIFQFALEKSDNDPARLHGIANFPITHWASALHVFQFAPLLKENILPDLLDNEQFILEVLSANPEAIREFNVANWSDDLALWFCWQYPQLEPLNFFPQMDNQPHLALHLLKHYPDNFKQLSDNLRNDLKIYIHAVNKNELSYLFQYAGEEIRNDSLRAWQAVSSFPHLYRHVGNKLKDDVIFFESVLKCHKDILQYAPDFIVHDKNCVLKSLQLYGENLQWAAPDLRKDTDFAMLVSQTLDSQQFSQCFQWWDATLFENKDFILTLSSYQWLAQHAEKISPQLRDDNEFMTKAILHCPQWLEYCSERLKIDSSFFISLYHTIEQNSEKAVRFDKLSSATKLFSFLSVESVNDLNFMTDLYEEFHMIFPTIVFPEIMNKPGDLMKRMKKASQNDNGLEYFMNRLRLHKQLLKEEEEHEQNNSADLSEVRKI
jgi:hypothetical protein